MNELNRYHHISRDHYFLHYLIRIQVFLFGVDECHWLELEYTEKERERESRLLSKSMT
jgi:hypothetical protein